MLSFINLKVLAKKKAVRSQCRHNCASKNGLISNSFDFTRRYKKAISNTDLDKANRLRLTGIKKY